MEHTPSRRQKRELRQLNEDISSVLGTPEGRRVFVWFLGLTGIYTPSFGVSDGATAFREGKRAVGLSVIGQLQSVDPMGYVNLLRDAIAQELSTRVNEETDNEFE